MQLVPFALVLAIFYFVILLPMKKRQKKVQVFLEALKVGDRVVTTGGLYGTVVGLSEHTVTLKVADQVKLDFERGSIGRIVPVAGDKESNA